MKQLTWYLDSFISKYSFGGKPWGLGYEGGNLTQSFTFRKGLVFASACSQELRFLLHSWSRGLEGLPAAPHPQVASGHPCPSRALAPRAGDLTHLSSPQPGPPVRDRDRPSGELWAQRWVANRFKVRKWPRGPGSPIRQKEVCRMLFFVCFSSSLTGIRAESVAPV